MPNHIHLIAVPDTSGSLARAIGQGHEAYTKYVNFRNGWRGYLWQGRFGSFPMDERHLLLAARYIELNPVRSGIVSEPENYRWSSARAHLTRSADPFFERMPLLERVPNWRHFLSEGMSEMEMRLIERHERTGRPLGSTSFISQLEKETNLQLAPKKRGRKPKAFIAEIPIQACVPNY